MRHVNARHERAGENVLARERRSRGRPGVFSAARRAALALFRNVVRSITGFYERIIRIYTYLKNHYATVPTTGYRSLYIRAAVREKVGIFYSLPSPILFRIIFVFFFAPL